jgi:uncharacterized protein CbrC (UPF0167 family)
MFVAATFRYFERPHQFSTYTAEPRTCDICGRVGPGYVGPFYGLVRLAFVCEECLSAGRLAAYDTTANRGDRAALDQWLRQRAQALSAEERRTLVRERTAELEHRTPHLTTWQDFFWPAHCGDYCTFIKEVGQPELSALAPDGDGVTFLASHARDVADLEHAREVWSGVRPDAPEDGTVAYSLGVYLFQCLVCQEYVVLWDCD